jgi:nucleoside-diphosphate-sugar epimerase
MIIFTAGGALYEAFAAKYICHRISVREQGPEKLVSLLQEGDILVHNAANIASTDLSTAIGDNFILTRDIVDALNRSGKGVSMIFISSMSFLDKGGKYKEAREMGSYAFAKYIAELYCLKSGVRVSSVRFSTLFYRNPARDGLSKMIADAASTGEIRLINGGKDRRDFIPLAIAVQYIYKLCVADKREPLYNIASGESVSFAEAAALIKELIPALKISNQEKPFSAQYVLSEFGKEDMERLGIIPFSLSDHIHQYTGELL